MCYGPLSLQDTSNLKNHSVLHRPRTSGWGVFVRAFKPPVGDLCWKIWFKKPSTNSHQIFNPYPPPSQAASRSPSAGLSPLVSLPIAPLVSATPPWQSLHSEARLLREIRGLGMDGRPAEGLRGAEGSG